MQLPEDGRIEKLVLENQRLLSENNQLLKKIQRDTAWAFWLRIVWIAILLGIPFITYYYIIDPYYETLQSIFDYIGVTLPESERLPNFIRLNDSGN